MGAVTLLALEPSVPAIVIGYGSIGSRHARVLERLGRRVSVVSRRPGVHARAVSRLEEALAGGSAGYVVVANETAEHRATLARLRECGYRGRLLVEKPLWHAAGEGPEAEPPEAFVAYHLRFDPLLLALREALRDQPLASAEIRACSYLPDWRPGRDYRLTESASRAAGGGVLRDMSHELDFAQWLFGPWRRLAAVGGRLGRLEIETEDAFALLLETERCRLVTVSLNYLDRIEERWIIVNAGAGTYRADLVRGTLSLNGESFFESPPPADLDELYAREHRALLGGLPGPACTFAEGRAVVELIAAAERAAASGSWVAR